MLGFTCRYFSAFLAFILESSTLAFIGVIAVRFGFR